MKQSMMKRLLCVLTVAGTLCTAAPLTAASGDLTAQELFEKYSDLYQIRHNEYGWQVDYADTGALHDQWYDEAVALGYIPADAPKLGESPVYDEKQEWYTMSTKYHLAHTYYDENGDIHLKTSYIRCAYEDGFYYDYRADGSAVIVNADPYYLMEQDPEKLVIPQTIGGAAVTEIGAEAFSDWYYIPHYMMWDSLQEVVIPDTVETVGAYAFSGIFGKKTGCKMNLPANLRVIGRRAFTGLYNAFGDVIELPETVEYLADDAFDGTVGRHVLPYTEAQQQANEENPAQNILPDTVDVRIRMPKSLVFTVYAVPHNATRISPEQLASGGYRGEFEKYYLNGECNIVCFSDALKYQIAKQEAEDTRLLEDTYWEMRLDETGDINTNGSVDIADAVLLARVIAEDSDVQISSQGYLNADINLDGSVDAVDSAELLVQLAEL